MFLDFYITRFHWNALAAGNDDGMDGAVIRENTQTCIEIKKNSTAPNAGGSVTKSECIQQHRSSAPHF